MKRRIPVVALCMMVLASSTAQAATVSGKVVDAKTDQPVAGVSVICEHHENRNSDSPDDFQMTAKTAEDGTFKLVLPPHDDQFMAIIVDKNGCVVDGRAHIDKDTDFGTVTLGNAYELSGMVYDSKGAPLAGAGVKAMYRIPKLSCKHVVEAAKMVSGADGSFAFPSLPAGTYDVKVSAAGHAPGEVEVSVSDDMNYAEIKLELGAVLEGKVVDAAGAPVPGVKVLVQGADAVTSGVDGSYTVQGLRAGSVAVRIDSEAFALAADASEKLECKIGETTKRDLQVQRAGKLEVTLQPADASVKMPTAVGAGLSPKKRAHSASYVRRESEVKDGKAVFTGLSKGEFSVSLSGDGMADTTFDVIIAPGATTATNVLLAKVFGFSGRVTDVNGNPLEDASVMVSTQMPTDRRGWSRMSGENHISRYESTDDKGIYQIDALPEGTYDLQVTASGLMPSRTVVEVGIEKQPEGNIVLQKGLSISGSVLAADGSPAPGLTIRSQGPKEDQKAMYSSISSSDEITTGAAGEFEITGLVTGTYEIAVYSERDQLATVPGTAAGSDDVMVMLAAKHKVSVRVRDEAGKPVADAVISHNKTSADMDIMHAYYGGRDDDEEAIRTDAQGHATLELMEGSFYQISARKEGLLPGAAKADLAHDKIAMLGVVEVTLKEGVIVTGTIKDADGKPLQGVKARVQSGASFYGGYGESYGDEDNAEGSDAEGKFTLKNVEPGVVTIVAFEEGEEGRSTVLAQKKIQVAAGKPGHVDLLVGRLGSVKGVIQGSDGQPLAEAGVYMVVNSRNPQQPYESMSGADGTFEIKSVAPGTYSIMCWNQDNEGDGPGKRMLANVTVVEGKCTEVVLKPAGAFPDAITISGTISEGGKSLGAGKIHFMPKPEGSADMDMMEMWSEPVNTEVGADGSFKVEAIAPGDYIYRFMAANGDDEDEMEAYYGTVSGLVKIEKGVDKLAIDLPTEVLKIQVVDTNGTGVSSAQVSVAPDTKDMMSLQMFARPGKAGENAGDYIVQRLEKGSYMVYVMAEGSALSLKGVKVPQTETPLKLVAGEGRELTGTLAIAGEASTRGAGIVVFSEGARMPMDFSEVSNDGTFKSSGKLQPGEYLVFAVLDGYTMDAKKVDLAKEDKINMVIEPAGSVDVTVVDADGKGVNGKTVTVRDETGVEIIRIKGVNMDYGYGPWGMPGIKATDENGATSVSGLKPGNYTIEVDGTGKKGKIAIEALGNASTRIQLE